MKVLILTGKFGMGHWSAAHSLKDDLTREIPEAEAEVVDLFQWMAPGCAEALYKAFSLLVTHGSGLYNLYYRATGHSRPGGSPLVLYPLLDKMEELIRAYQPDGVISTHPLCAQLAALCRHSRGLSMPLVTCITDMSIHPEWICPGTDCYLAGSEEVRRGLIRQGAAPERVLVTGIPVRPEFKAPVSGRPAGARELLLMGGGLGLLPKEADFYEGLNKLEGVHTTVITGNNRKLYEQLAGCWPNITVLGYTDQVQRYMSRAKLMVSKPGGITLSEAIYTGLPLLMPKPFLQQERNNAAFAVRHGVGRVAPKDWTGCLKAIRSLIYDDETLDAMARAMLQLREELEEGAAARMLARLASGTGRCA